VNYAQFLAECDEALRSGRGVEVKSRLAALNTKSVPDEFRLPLARQCRRINEVNVGLRLLTPRVRPERVSDARPTTAERAEYAALLNMGGATREALSTLKELDPSNNPEIHLFRAFCLMAQWDYVGVRENLQKYLAAPLDNYARFVGRVNLASALLVIGDARVREDLNILITEAVEMKHQRLLGNLLEMRAQLNLREARYADVAADLAEAEALLNGDGSLDLFFVRKWKSILKAVSEGDRASLEILAKEAMERGEWATVREAELHSLKIQFDTALFNKLYFGTSAKCYRERIVRELGCSPMTSRYLFGSAEGPVLKLAAGELNGRRVAPHVLRLLKALSRDLYRPQNVGALHSELFPGEYFNIHSSPNRIYQVITRARKWLRAHSVPIEIRYGQSGFSMVITGSLRIELEIETPVGDSRLHKLLETFGSEHFSYMQVREKMNLSRSTFQRLMNSAQEMGVLQRFGHGSAVTYRLDIRAAG